MAPAIAPIAPLGIASMAPLGMGYGIAGPLGLGFYKK